MISRNTSKYPKRRHVKTLGTARIPVEESSPRMGDQFAEFTSPPTVEAKVVTDRIQCNLVHFVISLYDFIIVLYL